MYQIVHGTAGLLIGEQINQPWLAFILGVISHFVLDAIPHDIIEIRRWQDKGNFIKRTSLEAAVDLSLFLILLGFLWLKGNLALNYSVLAGVLGALLPDYIWGVGELFKIKNRWLEKYKQLHNGDHALFHKNIYIPLKYGLFIQLFFLFFFLSIYLRFFN
jgi:membrane protein DedA with SNARE-associated domain